MKTKTFFAVWITLTSPVAFACSDCSCQPVAKAETNTLVGVEASGDPTPGNQKSIARFEQDRKAILDMAGTFKVTFHFEETVSAQPGYELKKPYHEEAAELVKVVEDTGNTIRMQHILVVNRGPSQDPIVVKHWRQDWTYEDNAVFGYRGRDVWEKEALSTQTLNGTWSQAVYQTDDSPRYEAIGVWVHEGDQSYWESRRTWRPLPRREHSKRSDYDVLAVRNRHTITPAGWVHEQDNRKLVLDESGVPIQVIAHEIGVNSYERIKDEKGFAPALAYWEATERYWADVRAAWDQVFSGTDVLKIDQKNDHGRLRESLADLAEVVELSGEYPAATKAEVVATIAHHVQ